MNRLAFVLALGLASPSWAADPPLAPEDAKLFGRLKAAIDSRVEARLASAMQDAAEVDEGKAQAGLGLVIYQAIKAIVAKLVQAAIYALVLAYAWWVVVGVVGTSGTAGWLAGKFGSRK